MDSPYFLDPAISWWTCKLFLLHSWGWWFLVHSLNFSSLHFFLLLKLVRLVSASASLLRSCCLACPSPGSYWGLLVDSSLQLKYRTFREASLVMISKVPELPVLSIQYSISIVHLSTRNEEVFGQWAPVVLGCGLWPHSQNNLWMPKMYQLY